MSMKRALHGLGLFVLLTAIAASPVWPQEPYPTRPISIVVAFPPGGVADNTARPVAAVLERILKQPVTVLNKAGAAGPGGNPAPATRKPHRDTPVLGPGRVFLLPQGGKILVGPPH